MATNTTEVGSLAALSRFGSGADTLWTGIAPARRLGTLRTIVFVGAGHGVGTTTTALCTAVGLARHLRAKVMLVEIGLGASALAPLLGLSDGPGLTQVLAGTASSASCVRGCGLEGLAVVTSAGGVAAPGDFASERTRKLFEDLGAGRDFLLIDAPPLVAHPELHPILLHAREAVMVLEAGRTTREEASSLMEILVRSGVDVLGSVLNRVQSVPFA